MIKAHIDGEPGAAIEAITAATPSFARAVAARRSRWSAAFTEYDGVLRGEQAIGQAAALRFARDRAVILG